MTPYQLEILLWYRSRIGDWERMDAPIWRDTINRLMHIGLMRGKPAGDAVYELTSKGRYYVDEGLCRVPLPETCNIWIIPWPIK